MEENQLLERLERLFDGFFEWLAGQYDEETGGFYYAKSSISDERFKPDIESTAQALNILQRNGLMENMPDWFRKKLIRFFQSKQDPDTGFFYDEHPAMRKDEVMVSRALNYSLGALDKLGSSSLYNVPYRLNKAPDFTESVEKYKEKWAGISLVNSWRGCDLLASSCAYIYQMPMGIQEEYVKTATDYLESIQDPETGLWGEGSLYVRISGTFKLHTFYSKYNIPMPRKEKIYTSIYKCLKTELADDMCYIRNPINLLTYLKVQIPERERLDIIRITIENMEKLKRDDGGFSREIGNSPSAPNVAQVKEGEFYPNMPEPVPLSLGLYEGDMNAGTQAVLIRMLIYELLGQKAKPCTNAKRFYQFLGNKR